MADGGLPPLPAHSLALGVPRPLILQPLDQVGHSLNERSAQWRQQEPLVTTNLGLSRHSGPPKGPRPPGLSTRQGAWRMGTMEGRLDSSRQFLPAELPVDLPSAPAVSPMYHPGGIHGGTFPPSHHHLHR